MQRSQAPRLPGLGAPLKGAWGGTVNPFELHNMLEAAIEHHKAGRAVDAERGYQMVLAKVPGQPDALNLLGVLAVEAGNHEAAADLFQRAIETRPKDPVILNNSGNALIHARRFEEGIATLEQCLSLDPAMPDAWLNLGRAFNQTDRAEKAKRCFQELLKLKPESIGALVGMARSETELGRFNEAEVLARQMIETAPEGSMGYVALANIRKFKPEDPELGRIEALLAREDLKPGERRGLSFAAGKMCDDLGRYDDAFRYYSAANELRDLHYDHRQTVAFYDDLIRTYTPKFFKDRAGWGSKSERPIFIVGMPRSGTTLVETILSAHEHVAAAGELETIKRIERDFGDIVREDRGPAFNAQGLSWFAVERQAERYLEVLQRKNPTARHVTDKMPHNFQALGLIALMFPRAKIIHCRRHPLDTILSCWMQNFNDGHAYARTLEDAAHHYKEYLRLMAHWKAVLPLPVFELDYEKMVGDQEATTRALLDFAGLDWDPRCLAFHEVQRTVMTASIWQVRQPLYSRSVARHKRYDRHMGEARKILGL